MFHKPVIGDTEPTIEHPPPPPPEVVPLLPDPESLPELPLPDPEPLPLLAVKLAEHVLLAFMVMVHVVLLQPEQSPVHPAKV
jgi:hypothetical protein